MTLSGGDIVPILAPTPGSPAFAEDDSGEVATLCPFLLLPLDPPLSRRMTAERWRHRAHPQPCSALFPLHLRRECSDVPPPPAGGGKKRGQGNSERDRSIIHAIDDAAILIGQAEIAVGQLLGKAAKQIIAPAR